MEDRDLGRRLGGCAALPIAVDDDEAKRIVAKPHDKLIFEILDDGSLAGSWRFGRAKPARCVPLDLAGLRHALDVAMRERERPHGSWRT